MSVTTVLAVDPPGSLEEAINGALQNHPDIISAQAKIRVAQAEYDTVRLEVVRKTLATWSELTTQRTTAERVRAHLSVANPAEAAEAKRALVDTEARLEQLATQLHYMTRFSGGMGTAGSGADNTLFIESQLPRTKLAEEAARKLASKISIEVQDTAMPDVIDFLNNQKFHIQADTPVLGDLSNRLVTLKLTNVSLAGVLQAIEDMTDLRFVIRDYGILLTDRGIAAERGYVTVIDYLTNHLGIDLRTLEEEAALKEAEAKSK